VTTLDKLLLEYCHPVGSLYWSKNSTGSLFGGTWERIKDKFILAAGDAHAIGEIGGEESHTLTENELPKIHGGIGLHGAEQASFLGASSGALSTGTQQDSYRAVSDLQLKNNNAAKSGTSINLNFGGNQPHNNMPPYLALYCWIRTA
jgi:microcystin-dependent protein